MTRGPQPEGVAGLRSASEADDAKAAVEELQTRDDDRFEDASAKGSGWNYIAGIAPTGVVDGEILRRIDIFLLLTGGWFVLSLVVASIAVMALDVFLGFLSLAVVILTTAVGVSSYLRSRN
ncbi:hypothetical protein NDI56_13530 [Haloarcula sp. S1CR25-12]|uniref:Uncharacterized protein n=1 Tax=Haloarcula saliterrae TaxID=2950534 RepID=A0ABU2FFD5_9EURY|nr:hypothetical protein [Haloarcula sp. S1CR25-12]MDS0260420.1 hypothetical protein [Haloarcula sp. S1CR25-12]